MILQEGTLRFNFTGAINAIKFDEQDIAAANCHGLSHCMKAVDFVVEYDDYYLFVEIKNPKNFNRYVTERDKLSLIKDLTTKFRDTFLYHWAEDKLNKPIRYQCLVELDNAQTLYLMNQFKKQLPTDKLPKRWQRPLSNLCAVTNLSTWNMTFPNIQVSRVAGDAA